MENYQDYIDYNENKERNTDNTNSKMDYHFVVETLKNQERNELIEELKTETVPPIEGVRNMKKISESDVMKKISLFFSNKIDENIKKGNGDELLYSGKEEIKQITINLKGIKRDEIKLQDIQQNQNWIEVFNSNPAILNNKNIESFKTDEEFVNQVKLYFGGLGREKITLNHKHKEIISRNTIKRAIDNKEEADLRTQLYKLFSENDELYQGFLNSIGADEGFILGVENRGNRGGSETRGWHMGVDYNLPKGTPVNSIYEGTVVAIGNQEGIEKDPNIERSIDAEEEFKKRQEQFNNLPKDKKGASSMGSMMLIKHEIGGKTFYSYYLHITPDKGIKIRDKVEKGQVVGKLAGYDTNGHRQPHLHFTIMTDVKAPMLSGYLNKNSITEDEKRNITNYNEDEKLQDLYDNNYGKYMIDPMEVYN